MPAALFLWTGSVNASICITEEGRCACGPVLVDSSVRLGKKEGRPAALYPWKGLVNTSVRIAEEGRRNISSVPVDRLRKCFNSYYKKGRRTIILVHVEKDFKHISERDRMITVTK